MKPPNQSHPTSSSSFSIVLGISFPDYCLPKFKLLMCKAVLGHCKILVTCQSALNKYLLFDSVLGTRDKMVNKTVLDLKRFT